MHIDPKKSEIDILPDDIVLGKPSSAEEIAEFNEKQKQESLDDLRMPDDIILDNKNKSDDRPPEDFNDDELMG